MNPAKSNADAELVRLAQLARRADRQTRCLCRGKAVRLIGEHYPDQRAAVRGEWQRLAEGGGR